MAGIRHHLIDIAGPEEAFSAARFKNAAETVMDGIKSGGRVPVIAGGTGLYLNAVMKGIMKTVEPDAALKAGLRAELEEKGLEALAQRLSELDPEAASQTDLKNSRRVVRALEIICAGGMKLSELKKSTADTAYRDKHLIFILWLPRQELYARIDSRVDKMVKDGLVEEVKNLLNNGINDGSASMQAIGYKEIAAHLSGGCSLDEAISAIKKATRNYAKRQETWFKRYKDAVRINMTGKKPAEAAAEIEAVIKARGIK
jgi:tRNA dimethylallyltransferase